MSEFVFSFKIDVDNRYENDDLNDVKTVGNSAAKQSNVISEKRRHCNTHCKRQM